MPRKGFAKGDNEKAIEKAVRSCDREFEPGNKSLFEWQDCIQGVNIAKRLVRRGASAQAAEKAGLQICDSNEKHPGPRARCRGGVKKFVIALKRRS